MARIVDIEAFKKTLSDEELKKVKESIVPPSNATVLIPVDGEDVEGTVIISRKAEYGPPFEK